jgi:hypothetical protein
LGLPSRTHGTPQGRKLQEHMKFLRVSPKGWHIISVISYWPEPVAWPRSTYPQYPSVSQTIALEMWEMHSNLTEWGLWSFHTPEFNTSLGLLILVILFFFYFFYFFGNTQPHL